MPVVVACLRKRTAATVALVLGMAACGPERGAAEDDAANDPDVPWLMGVFTAHEVGENFSSAHANVYEFREGGEGVVWQTRISRAEPGEPNMKWEAQSTARVRVEPSDAWTMRPFIVAPTSSCNELRSSTIANDIEPTDAELRTPLYRGELCVTSVPEAIGGAFNFDYCDGPPPPCDEQPD